MTLTSQTSGRAAGPAIAADTPRAIAGMQSPRALFGSLAILAALPLAILSNISLGGGDVIVVHVALGAGMLLLASATFDFRTPSVWNWAGMVAMLSLGAIFLAQGVAETVQSPALFAIVYGNAEIQAVERWAAYPILLWCAALLVTHSAGKTRLIGALSLGVIAAAEVYGFWVSSQGGVVDVLLRLAYLPVFGWLAVEGAKARAQR